MGEGFEDVTIVILKSNVSSKQSYRAQNIKLDEHVMFRRACICNFNLYQVLKKNLISSTRPFLSGAREWCKMFYDGRALQSIHA